MLAWAAAALHSFSLGNSETGAEREKMQKYSLDANVDGKRDVRMTAFRVGSVPRSVHMGNVRLCGVLAGLLREAGNSRHLTGRAKIDQWAFRSFFFEGRC